MKIQHVRKRAGYENAVFGLEATEVLLKHFEVSIIVGGAPGLGQGVDYIHTTSKVWMVVPAFSCTHFHARIFMEILKVFGRKVHKSYKKVDGVVDVFAMLGWLWIVSDRK